jgi:hypothetical protein
MFSHLYAVEKFMLTSSFSVAGSLELYILEEDKILKKQT